MRVAFEDASVAPLRRGGFTDVTDLINRIWRQLRSPQVNLPYAAVPAFGATKKFDFLFFIFFKLSKLIKILNENFKNIIQTFKNFKIF